jgi:hypothetical protein
MHWWALAIELHAGPQIFSGSSLPKQVSSPILRFLAHCAAYWLQKRRQLPEFA